MSSEEREETGKRKRVKEKKRKRETRKIVEEAGERKGKEEM